MAFAHGMANKIRSNGSPGSRTSGLSGLSGSLAYSAPTVSSIPRDPQLYKVYSAEYERKEQGERARLLKNKEKGEDYVRINLVEVPLSDGVYQTICPSADNGLMKVTVEGENKMVEYENQGPKPLREIEDFIEAAIAKRIELAALKRNANEMTEPEIKELAKNISLNNTALQRFVKPNRFWKYVDPNVIEEKKKKTENILLSLKYYKQLGVGLSPDINYYRNYPPAKNGIATLKFKLFQEPDRIPVFNQTYVDENGKNKTETVLIYHEPIWTRNMVLAKMYKSASAVGGRKRKRTRKRSPK